MENMKNKDARNLLQEDYEYEVLGDETVSITSYKGKASDILLPCELDGRQVTKLGELAFSWCESLRKITIPEGITCIEDYAFHCCQNLVGALLPDSLVSIGNNAFFGCCSLPCINIPKGVKKIGDKSFSSCDSLKFIHVAPENVVYADDRGVLFNKNKTELCIYPCGNSFEEYQVPDGVTSIGEYAFYYCTSLKSVKIAKTVTSIQEGAFYGCGIRYIELSDCIRTIGAFAFAFCKDLTEVRFSTDIIKTGDYAFLSCSSLKTVGLSDDITEIDRYRTTSNTQ